MKVILLKDVAKIGRRFDIVVVPDGYALNKLLPNGMAKPATPENVKLLLATKEKQKEGKEHDKIAFADLLTRLEQTTLTLQVETNAEGTLFQALKPHAIAEAIKLVSGTTLSEDHIVITTPIKSVGVHSVTLVTQGQKKNIEITLIAKDK